MSDTITSLSLELQIADADVARRRRHLAMSARSISERLGNLAEQLENPDRDPIINDLGEIQSDGSILNASCGAYSAAKDHLKAIRRLAEAHPELLTED